MAKKNITIDELAVMVQKGFDDITGKMATKQQFERLEKDVRDMKKDLSEVKHDLKETIKRTDKVEMRVDYVENVLAIKKI